MLYLRVCERAVLFDRALFGYEGQTDVLKLVGKGGQSNRLPHLTTN